MEQQTTLLSPERILQSRERRKSREIDRKNNSFAFELDDVAVKAAEPQTLIKKKMELAALQEVTHTSVEQASALLAAINNHADMQVEREAFRQILRSSGLALADNDALVDHLYVAFDADRSKSIEKKELIVGIMVLLGGSLDAKLRLGFSTFDVNNDAFIEPAELASMLCNMGKLAYQHDALQDFVSSFVATTFRKYDVNGDGKLSLDEWMTAAKENPEICSIFSLSKFTSL